MLTYTDGARTLCGHFWTTVTDIYIKYCRNILCIILSTTVQRVWYSYGWRGKGKTKNLSGTTSHLYKSLPACYDRSWKWRGGTQRPIKFWCPTLHYTHNRSLSCSPQELKLRACAVFALKADLDSCALLARDNLCTYMSHSSKNTV